MNAHRRLAGLVAVGLVAASAIGAAPAAAADPTPTTVLLSPSDPPHLIAGHTVTLRASVFPWQYGDGGSIALSYAPSGGGAEVPIATLAVSNGGVATEFPADESARPADGTYTFIARFSGSTTLADSEASGDSLFVGPYKTSLGLSVYTGRPDGSARQRDQVELNAAVSPGEYAGGNPLPMTGSVTFSATNTATTVGLGTALLPATGVVFDAGVLAIGTWQVSAAYSGDSAWKPALSDPTAVLVQANIAEASGVGVSATSIYPIVDGFRDTLRIVGNRLEPLSNTIRIRNSAGGTVRGWNLPRAAGPYAITWNGRTASGVLVAAGTYRIYQTLTDAFGARLAVSSSVSLSHKRLYWHTSTWARLGNAFSTSARTGTGRVSTTHVLYANGVRICCGSSTGTPGYFAAVGYTFTVPRAARYSSLTVRVYANGRPEGLSGLAGVQVWTRCTSTTTFVTYTAQYINGCFEPLYGLPTGYAATALRASPATAIRSRVVRAIVKQGAGTTDIAKVTLTLRYAVLA